MKTITADELTQFAQECKQLGQDLNQYRLTKLARNQITEEENKTLKRQKNKLLDCAIKLNARAILVRVADLEDAVAQLHDVTQQLASALQQLAEIKKVINAVTGLINIVTDFLSAIAAGNPVAIARSLEETLATLTG